MTAAHDYSLWLGDLRLLAPARPSAESPASRESVPLVEHDATVASRPSAVRDRQR